MQLHSSYWTLPSGGQLLRELCSIWGRGDRQPGQKRDLYWSNKQYFKKRYYGHRHSFKNRNSEHSTTLSSHIWNLKDKNENYSIKWKVIDRASKFNPITRKCRLCIKEKYHIIFQPEGATLNERSELFSTCRHRLDKLLENT